MIIPWAIHPSTYPGSRNKGPKAGTQKVNYLDICAGLKYLDVLEVEIEVLQEENRGENAVLLHRYYLQGEWECRTASSSPGYYKNDSRTSLQIPYISLSGAVFAPLCMIIG